MTVHPPTATSVPFGESPAPPLTPAADAALEPVRAALLASARADADAVLAQARAQVADRLGRARDRAAGLVAQAWAEGEAAAELHAAADRARCRREARRLVLAAQRTLEEALDEAVVAGARRLRRHEGYPGAVARLSDRARTVLGPQAEITESIDGGVVAASATRRLDLRLTTLARAALADRAGELNRVWTP